MSIADTDTSHRSANGADSHQGKILHLRESLKAKTGAVSQWAHDRADKVRGAVEQRPIATAGMSAGVAFVGGLALGLLLAGRLGGLRSASRALPRAMPRDLVSRAQAMLPHDLTSRTHDLAARIKRRF